MNIPFVDSFLNKITMYRIVLYHLVILNAVAFVLSFFHFFSFTPWALLFSFFLMTAVCWASNEAIARLFKVTPNTESVYITAFILSLILTPVWFDDLRGIAIYVLAGVIAMASKYILAINKKHIFNPAALAVAITGIVFGTYASWWVGGTLSLLPFVLIGGLLVVRKVQRFDQFWSFSIVALAGVAINFLPQNPIDSIWQTLLHSSLFFFVTIMLTEPLTSPVTRIHRIIYAAIAGLFFIPGMHIGSFYFAPEYALLIGNVYAYVVSPKVRRVLTLKERTRIAEDVYDFTFTPNTAFSFKPGQYVEWTLGHAKPDQRGNRRYFTIASSPTEKEIHLGIKTYEPSSTFKTALLALEPGQTIAVGQLAGEFTLPKDPKKKLVFIAGGIGVTPFRSMIQYLMDEDKKRDAVLLYSTKSEDEIAYRSIFTEAEQKIGLKTYYDRMITKDALMREVPDYKDRVFYISGPRGMVVGFEKTLKELGVPRRNIKIDFFPGFA
jgi:ferredoxin-NADP reductase/Na+-translocating ferredoxin:NAD+ oxidoreductase RnfD subunit